MDLATLIGLMAAFGIVMVAIVMGGNFALFIDGPSTLIVLGGTIATSFIRFPLASVFNAFGVAVNAFIHRTASPLEIIDQAVEIATLVRREGLLSLENRQVEDRFLGKGLGLCVDGHSPDFVRRLLTQDMNQNLDRHELGQRIWRAIGETAPAMGMIGTLIGLVQMLSHMDSPEKIGPSMALALLTTLYGALLANLVALPIAEKLEVRSFEERLAKSLIIETVCGIQAGVHPRVMDETLRTFLPNKKRAAAENEG